MINSKLTVNGDTINDVVKLKVDRNIQSSNATSSFIAEIDSPFGRHATDFSLNDEIIIYADIDATPTTKIFTGIIEDINFKGEGNKQKVVIKGRDYGAILQDTNTQSRVFSNKESSVIVTDIMSQNISSDIITTTNVNVSTTTIDKITFANISVFDALTKIAEIAGFYFYVDENKDLHYKQKDQISSGVTFDNSNVLDANIRTSDNKIVNRVTVYGERQLTAVRQIFTTGTDNTGSVYNLTDKPHNTTITFSGTAGQLNTVLTPGGVVGIDNPAINNVKYLVDFQGKNVILASGTTAGDNTLPAGSVVLIDYQRSTPIVSQQQDIVSQQAYGIKDKVVIDSNIKSFSEANTKAVSILNEGKDPAIQADLQIKSSSILNLTPGNTAILNLSQLGENNSTYRIVNVSYNFTPNDVFNESVLTVTLSKKVADFIDIMKQEMLRLRAIEAGQFNADITSLKSNNNTIIVAGSTVPLLVPIGSAFYFNVPNHDVLESPTSLLGDVRRGSEVPQNLISNDIGVDFIYSHAGTTSSLNGSFSFSPHNSARGMEIKDGNLYVADNTSNHIFKLNGVSAAELGSIQTPGIGTRGLTFAGDDLITSDAVVNRIYVHNGFSTTLNGSFVLSAGHNARGLTWDGTNLISSSSAVGGQFINTHVGSSATLAGSFVAPGASVTGMTIDASGNLISCDDSENYIYFHSGISNVLTGSIATPNPDPFGVAITAFQAGGTQILTIA